jgi:Glycosyltransferase family 87
VNRTIRAVHGAVVDAALYASSAAFAGVTALVAGIPQMREWGRMAAIPYLAGAAAALFLAGRRSGVRARWWLAAAVLAGAAVMPLVMEVTWRSGTDPGLHAQSEVIVTEEAARAVVEGRNPYAASFEEGPLEARPIATQTHFPYLPGMLVFGIPRALDGRAPWSDARVWFAAAAMATLALALARSRAEPERRLLVAQVVLVLPTGALLMTTGGDDLPVVALMGLSLVLLDEGHATGSGVALGVAAALKQTAWFLLPFLVAASGRSARRTLAGAALAAAPVLVAFFVWDPAAFIEDVVRFPLGLGRGTSAAGTPTIGSLLVDLVPAPRPAVTLAVAAVAAGAGLGLLLRRPRPTVASAAGRTAAWLAVVIVLAPSARFGYVVYPLSLAAFAHLLHGTDPREAGPAGSPAEEASSR